MIKKMHAMALGAALIVAPLGCSTEGDDDDSAGASAAIEEASAGTERPDARAEEEPLTEEESTPEERRAEVRAAFLALSSSEKQELCARYDNVGAREFYDDEFVASERLGPSDTAFTEFRHVWDDVCVGVNIDREEILRSIFDRKTATERASFCESYKSLGAETFHGIAFNDTETKPPTLEEFTRVYDELCESIEPEYGDPTSDDFTLDTTILEKSCFGSAGCIVTIRVELVSTAPIQLDPNKTYELIYEIHGVEDARINRMQLQGESYSADDSERVQIAHESDEIRAEIISISER